MREMKKVSSESLNHHSLPVGKLAHHFGKHASNICQRKTNTGTQLYIRIYIVVLHYNVSGSHL